MPECFLFSILAHPGCYTEIISANLVNTSSALFVLPKSHNLKGLLVVLQPVEARSDTRGLFSVLSPAS